MNYQVAVRALCEFTAKVGDLDLRFTPSPSAQEGMAGHATVVGRRGPGYLAELPLAGAYRNLLVRGRADGYDPARNCLEEIKTHRGDISRIPDNHRQLHWAQAKVYGWLLCALQDLEAIDLAVVYFNVMTQKETVFQESFSADELHAFFEEHCQRFVVWAEREMAHRAARDTALESLRFPWPQFRHGQRQLAEAVYRAARDGRHLMAQATTGIGKTLGTLFPQLKAMPGQGLDRLFFLSAKTPGRRLALEALVSLRQDEPGALMAILNEFAVRGVNLTRIESRPTKRVLGDYFFSVDVEGHVADARVAEALMGLHRVCLDVRFLGSYPRHDGKAPVLRPGVTDVDFADALAWLDRLKESGS